MYALPAVLELFKLRLNLMVVFSSALGYFIGLTSFDIIAFSSLLTGGFLVTGASNGMNQIIERHSDALMDRTKSRPLPSGRLSPGESWLISSLSGAGGLLMLYFLVNPLTSVLAALSMFIYVVLYTPLKKLTPFSVFVGAFPGAIPPMLGYVAASGTFGLEAGLLFAIQFMWQFPHFWAIAWTVHDDYLRAGFRMLPSAGGKTAYSAFIILFHNLMLLPVSLMPFIFGLSGIVPAVLLLAAGILFSLPAFTLYYTMRDSEARKLMFYSFLYLPLALTILLLEKLI